MSEYPKYKQKTHHIVSTTWEGFGALAQALKFANARSSLNNYLILFQPTSIIWRRHNNDRVFQLDMLSVVQKALPKKDSLRVPVVATTIAAIIVVTIVAATAIVCYVLRPARRPEMPIQDSFGHMSSDKIVRRIEILCVSASRLSASWRSDVLIALRLCVSASRLLCVSASLRLCAFLRLGTSRCLCVSAFLLIGVLKFSASRAFVRSGVQAFKRSCVQAFVRSVVRIEYPSRLCTGKFFQTHNSYPYLNNFCYRN